MGGHGELFMLL